MSTTCEASGQGEARVSSTGGAQHEGWNAEGPPRILRSYFLSAEERASGVFGQIAEDIGFASLTGLDDAFIIPRNTARTLDLEPDVVRDMVIGECVRDWAAEPQEVAITPYSKTSHEALPLALSSKWGRLLWRYRTVANNVSSFGGQTRADEEQNWWEWYRWQQERYRAAHLITFAEVATHNHFVLDRGGRVFKQTAPIIKLPAAATEDDHLAILAYLNSSTACFWMKQVSYPKERASGDKSTEKWSRRKTATHSPATV